MIRFLAILLLSTAPAVAGDERDVALHAERGGAGDATRDVEIIARNKVRHPLFVAANPLKVVQA